VTGERFLERLTWPEVEAARERGVDAVLVPIGSTEQHGRHMPLDTDCFIARSLSARAAEAAAAEGLDVLVAPTLNVTVSWYHMQFPGSMRLSTTTFLDVFREVCLAEIEGPMIHAEEAETSIALALGQRVLEDERARDAFDRGAAVKEAGHPWTSFGKYGMTHKGPGVVVPMDMLRDISASGVVGDATRASRETGDRIVEALVPRIVQVCKETAGKE
jgi:creatinine amidohydrolase/Fe(II)-dependent formamide hydrolase-like protein